MTAVRRARGSWRPSLYDPELVERGYPDDMFSIPTNTHLRELATADGLFPRGWALHLAWAKNPVPLNRSGRTSGWRAEALAAAMVRDTAFQLVRGAIPEQPRIRIRLDWYPTTKRTRDADNLVKCAKHLVDGIALGRGRHQGAGIVPDDDETYVDRLFPKITPAPAGMPAHMRLWIWPLPALAD